MYDEKTDMGLVILCQKGDSDAFGEVWRRYYPYILGICFKFNIRDYHVAEELVQDVFQKISQNIMGYKDRNFKGWIATIAIRKCIDYNKSKDRHMKFFNDCGDNFGDDIEDTRHDQPSLESSSAELKSGILELVKELPHFPERTFLIDRYLHLVPVKIIAEKYSVAIQHVFYVLKKARRMLAEMIHKKYGDIDLSDLGLD